MLDRVVLKENEIFAVTDRQGNIRREAVDGQGLYYRDTRFLSVYELEIEDVPLQLLSSAGELNFMSNFQFGNLPSVLADRTEIAARSLSVRRNRFIDSGLHERIGIVSYNPTPVTLRLSLTVGSDFRDMFDVRGYVKRPQRGTVRAPSCHEDEITLHYLGLDQVSRSTQIRFSVPPAALVTLGPEAQIIGSTLGEYPSGGTMDLRLDLGPPPPLAQATFSVTLVPHEPWSLSVHLLPVLGEAADTAPVIYPSLDESFTRILDTYTQWDSDCTRITTDHELLNELVHQSLHDLRLTVNRVATGLLPVAGIPWFAVPFGRDSLITSLQTLCLNPDIAYGTLRFLARNQGKKMDPWRDEEPGKILHEVRSGEMATLGEVPQTPYYGSVDSTPLFVFLFSELLRWTDDMTLAADLRPHLEAALEWIRTYGDRDGDGLVEYQSQSTRGIHNQGWKDSIDSIAFPDGRLALAPIRIVEAQGYAYAAEQRMAEVYRAWADEAQALSLEASAAARKARFEATFWMEDEAFYALALDADHRQVPSVTSNPGHCFLMGLLKGPRADAVARRLIADDMSCGWGVRTLSSRYPTFNPMSYHNGSIWPHDNSLIAAGLRREGYDEAAFQVIQQILEAGFQLPDYRLPELYCGFSRDRRYQSAPATYPVSCSPQAWAAGSVFLMLQHLLGLEPNVAERRIVIRPMLLPWLNELRFENLRVGQTTLSITAWRDGEEVRCEVAGARGFDVVIAAPPTLAGSTQPRDR
jgi:glycogen debranching enzyme